MVSLERIGMNDLIAGVSAGLYSAFTGFSLAFQGLAGLWPHQAALAVSACVAVASFALGRISVRVMRVK